MKRTSMLLFLPALLLLAAPLRAQTIELDTLIADLHRSEVRGDSVTMALVLQRLAVAYQDSGQIAAADRRLERAQLILENIQDLPRLANCLNDRGIVSAMQSELDRARAYFTRSISLYEQNGDTTYLDEPLLNLSKTCALQGRHQCALTYARQALKFCREHGKTLSAATALHYLSTSLAAGSRYDSALICAKKSLCLARGVGDTMMIPILLGNIGAFHTMTGEVDSAVMYYDQCAEVARRQGDTQTLLNLCSNSGKLLFESGDYDRAMERFIQGRTLAEKSGDRYAAANIQSTIGMIFARQGMHEKALRTLHGSLEPGGRQHRTEVLSNIGVVHRMAGHPDSAMAYYQKALRNAGRFIPENSRIRLLTNIGDLHRIAGRRDSAAMCFRDAMALAKQCGDRDAEAHLYQLIGRLQQARDSLDSAISSFRHALRIADDLRLRELKQAILFDLGLTFAFRQDSLHARRNFDAYLALADTMNAEKTNKIIHELNTKYEVAQREKEIIVLEADRKLKQSEIARQREELRIRHLEFIRQRQSVELLTRQKAIQKLELDRRTAEIETQRLFSERNKTRAELLKKDNLLQSTLIERGQLLRNILIGGILVVLLFSGVISYRYRERNRMNAALNSTLRELQRTQKELIHAEKMAAIGQLSVGIAHEIRNPLNFITNFSRSSVDLFKEYDQTENEDEKKEINSLVLQNLQKISEHGQRADTIVQGMMHHVEASGTTKRIVDLHSMLDEVLDLALQTMKKEYPEFAVRIEKRYDPSVPPFRMVPKEMNRALYNIIDNAAYALQERQTDSPASYLPTLKIETLRIDTDVHIRIHDNGTGIRTEDLEHILQPFFTTRPPGEGTGLGLTLCYEIIVNGHGGKLTIDSREGEYTECHIVLPVSENTAQ